MPQPLTPRSFCFRLVACAVGALAGIAMVPTAQAASAPGSSCQHPLVFSARRANGHQIGNPRYVKLSVKENRSKEVGTLRVTWKVLNPNLEVCPMGVIIEVQHGGEPQPNRIPTSSSRSGSRGGLLTFEIAWIGITVKTRYIHPPNTKTAAAAQTEQPYPGSNEAHGPGWRPKTIYQCKKAQKPNTKARASCIKRVEKELAVAPGSSCKHPLEINHDEPYLMGETKYLFATLRTEKDASLRGATSYWSWEARQPNVAICPYPGGAVITVIHGSQPGEKIPEPTGPRGGQVHLHATEDNGFALTVRGYFIHPPK